MTKATRIFDLVMNSTSHDEDEYVYPHELHGYEGDWLCGGQYKTEEEFVDAVIVAAEQIIDFDLDIWRDSQYHQNEEIVDERETRIISAIKAVRGYDEEELCRLARQEWSEYQCKRFEEWLRGKADLMPAGLDPMDESLESLNQIIDDKSISRDARIFCAGAMHARTFFEVQK